MASVSFVVFTAVIILGATQCAVQAGGFARSKSGHDEVNGMSIILLVVELLGRSSASTAELFKYARCNADRHTKIV